MADDPYLRLLDGVLPAVDKVVELGFVDPERVGVFGHSYGGYSAYGLITQTNRFKAAVAMNGFADLIGMHGQLANQFHYESFIRGEALFLFPMEELGHRMAAPPWEDRDRYLRNSPITYVDRVETPVLIIHSDLDFIPIQQAEQFFTALYRQNKPAAFIRYGGEGHIIQTQANVGDMWQRIYTWFDHHLQSDANGSNSAGY